MFEYDTNYYECADLSAYNNANFELDFLPFSRSMWLVVGMFTFAFTFLFVIQNVAGYCKFSISPISYFRESIYVLR